MPLSACLFSQRSCRYYYLTRNGEHRAPDGKFLPVCRRDPEKWPQYATDTALRTMLLSPVQFVASFEELIQRKWPCKNDEQVGTFKDDEHAFFKDSPLRLKGPPWLQREQRAAKAQKQCASAAGESIPQLPDPRHRDLGRLREQLVVVFILDLCNAEQESIDAVHERFLDLEYYDHVGVRGLGGEWIVDMGPKGGPYSDFAQMKEHAKKSEAKIVLAKKRKKEYLIEQYTLQFPGVTLDKEALMKVYFPLTAGQSPLYRTVWESLKHLRSESDKLQDQLNKTVAVALTEKNIRRRFGKNKKKPEAPPIAKWMVRMLARTQPNIALLSPQLVPSLACPASPASPSMSTHHADLSDR